MHLIENIFLIWKLYLSASISTDACVHGSMFIGNYFNILMTDPLQRVAFLLFII